MSPPKRTFPFALATLMALASLASALPARQRLPACLRPAFSSAPRLGDLDPSTPLSLDLALPLPDPGALDAFIATLYDPHSPNFRHFLSPQAFSERFAPKASDYQALQDFARSAGFAVVAARGNRLTLRITGDSSHVQRAFHVTLGRRRRPDGSVFYAPDNEPSVDLDLPGLRVYGMDSFDRWRRISRRHPAQDRLGRHRAGGTGGQGSFQGYDFRDAYAPGVSLQGAGQIVGLVEFGGFYYADVTEYAASSNPPLPSNFNVQWLPVDGGFGNNPLDNGDTGFQGDDCSEVSLDIELALAMAPQAEILAFEAPFQVDNGFGAQPTLGDILSVVEGVTACAQVSCSWIGGDMGDAAAELSYMASTTGQAFFQASGDDGAYGADTIAGAVPEPQCLSPYITVVGGTSLNPGTGSSSESPPISYLSESTWNDYQGTCSDFADGFGGAGGGGFCSINQGNPPSLTLSLPSYQSGVAAAAVADGGSSQFRNIPDVSALAQNFWVVWCDQCPAADDDGTANQQATAFDGTSGAAPLWAAFTALVNEQIQSEGGARLGFADPALYQIAGGSGYTACFHDISDGSNNDIVSTSGHSAGESCDPSGSYFNAVTGYDLATGLGSPNGQALIAALAGTIVSPTVTPTLTVTPTFSDSPTATHTPSITPSFSDSPTATDSPSATPTPSITPTFTITPTSTDSSTVTQTFTLTPTPDYLVSSQTKAVLVNDPARNGEPVLLAFSQRPERTQWRVYDLAAQLVAKADIEGAGPHEVSTQNLATGVYFARVKIDYASGGSQTLTFKFAVIR